MASGRETVAGLRFQVTMSEALTAKVQAYADSFGISRSSAISVLVTQALQANESLNALGDLMSEIKKQKPAE